MSNEQTVKVDTLMACLDPVLPLPLGHLPGRVADRLAALMDAEAEAEQLREQIAWTVERCNAAMGDGFQGTPNSAVAAVCDEVERLRETTVAVRELVDEALDCWLYPIRDYAEIRPWMRRLIDALDVPDITAHSAGSDA